MNAAQVVAQLATEGVRLSLAPSGGLQVSGAKEAVARAIPLLRPHKAEIVSLLARAQPRREPEEGRFWTPGNPFVCRCGQRTGWTAEGKPRCPCCEYEATDSDARQGRLLAHANALSQLAAQTINPETKAARLAVAAAIRAEAISPPLLRCNVSGYAWCHDNLEHLLAAGWSRDALFRQGWPLGLARMRIWSTRDVTVTLEQDGAVVFTIHRHGRTIRQVARPCAPMRD